MVKSLNEVTARDRLFLSVISVVVNEKFNHRDHRKRRKVSAIPAGIGIA